MSDRRRWTRIEYELPAFGLKVLVCTEAEIVQIAYRTEELEYNEHWQICDDCSCSGATAPVVAWMYLPDLPVPCERTKTLNEILVPYRTVCRKNQQ